MGEREDNKRIRVGRIIPILRSPPTAVRQRMKLGQFLLLLLVVRTRSAIKRRVKGWSGQIS